MPLSPALHRAAYAAHASMIRGAVAWNRGRRWVGARFGRGPAGALSLAPPLPALVCLVGPVLEPHRRRDLAEVPVVIVGTEVEAARFKHPVVVGRSNARVFRRRAAQGREPDRSSRGQCRARHRRHGCRRQRAGAAAPRAARAPQRRAGRWRATERRAPGPGREHQHCDRDRRVAPRAGRAEVSSELQLALTPTSRADRRPPRAKASDRGATVPLRNPP
jgi:hypothetical protein